MNTSSPPNEKLADSREEAQGKMRGLPLRTSDTTTSQQETHLVLPHGATLLTQPVELKPQ